MQSATEDPIPVKNPAFIPDSSVHWTVSAPTAPTGIPNTNPIKIPLIKNSIIIIYAHTCSSSRTIDGQMICVSAGLILSFSMISSSISSACITPPDGFITLLIFPLI